MDKIIEDIILLLGRLCPVPLVQSKFKKFKLKRTKRSKNLLKNMVQQIIQPQSKNNLTDLVQDLNTNLTALKPDNSEMTKLITYVLMATAVVGIMVYQYIKEND
jgi:hypothetical protein